MEPKWKVFIFTFLSYTLVHASRTAWSSLKYTLNSTPFSFSPVYLGTLDMMVLVALATTLVLFGPKVVTGGPKEYLQKGMIVVSLILTVLGIMLLFNVTARYSYLIVYPFVGVFSFVGWPACLYVHISVIEDLIFAFWKRNRVFAVERVYSIWRLFGDPSQFCICSGCTLESGSVSLLHGEFGLYRSSN